MFEDFDQWPHLPCVAAHTDDMPAAVKALTAVVAVGASVGVVLVSHAQVSHLLPEVSQTVIAVFGIGGGMCASIMVVAVAVFACRVVRRAFGRRKAGVGHGDRTDSGSGPPVVG